ncbi:hypothetical protein ACLI09_03475 [Flavobacterium sp. RHBU_24]|uniref:hypothetical protein n=1 Tax=Flavobacterium sp. RHBU_24 TaxID=3391185 RepID=UPI003984A682
MKNSLILKFAILSLSFVIISCKREQVGIKIIGKEDVVSDTLIFNSKDTIITHGVIDSVFLSPYQKHTFTLNGSEPTAFNLREKGGILNIYNTEFVVYNVRYDEDDPNNEKYENAEINLMSCVMIDSFLIFEKKFENQLKDPNELRKIITEISGKKNGNYKTYYDERQELIEGGDYDTLNTLDGFEFKKIGKDKIFIEKFWDYDMNDNIPEEITVRTRKDHTTRQEKILKAIISDKDFLANAKIWKNKFYIVDIRDY